MPIQRGQNKTDGQRKSQNKYDAAHYKVAACKIPIEKYNQFQAYAAGRGLTVAGALSRYIDNCTAGWE